MFEVKFAGRKDGATTVAWEPAEGDGYLCSEREALRRWGHLMLEGSKRRKVDGVVPWCIEIFDADNGRLMLTITTEKGDEPSGPWAAMAKAA